MGVYVIIQPRRDRRSRSSTTWPVKLCSLRRNMNNTLPSAKPGTVLDQRTMRVPLYKVLLHNDDRNTMEHVVKALMHVFRFSKPVSERIMMEAHLNVVAICTVEPLEQAELHRDQLRSFSLTATIEPD